jgi:tetratricopeptide (TPR) repeat protein
MAPEQHLALTAVAERHPVPAAVDGRADIYALGVLLAEALGQAESADEPGAELQRRNPLVTTGLADILNRCLALDPAARYPGAAALAADLRRHLADLPLRGVANRSFVERWRKWRRRRPHALGLLGLLLAGLVIGGLLAGHCWRQTRAAEAAWQQGTDYLREHRPAEARDAFRAGTARIESVPFVADLRRRLEDGAGQAERAQLREQLTEKLHQLCERVRPLYGLDALPAGQARAAAEQCQELWQKRDLIVRHLGQPSAPLEEQLRDDLLDLAILCANLRVRGTPAGKVVAARRAALDVLAQAETFLGPNCVLYQERRTHAQALGLTDLAGQAARHAAALAPRSAWEHYALGRVYLETGDLARADEHFDRALELEPQGLWPNFCKGVCAYRLGQYEDALAAFSSALALAPRSASCWYNRGQTYAELGRPDRALRDYDCALRLEPDLVAALLGRSAIHCRLQRYAEALADLECARGKGADRATVAYQRALIHLARQDRAAAAASLRDALRIEPGHAQAQELLRRLELPQ